MLPAKFYNLLFWPSKNPPVSAIAFKRVFFIKIIFHAYAPIFSESKFDSKRVEHRQARERGKFLPNGEHHAVLLWVLPKPHLPFFFLAFLAPPAQATQRRKAAYILFSKANCARSSPIGSWHSLQIKGVPWSTSFSRSSAASSFRSRSRRFANRRDCSSQPLATSISSDDSLLGEGCSLSFLIFVRNNSISRTITDRLTFGYSVCGFTRGILHCFHLCPTNAIERYSLRTN